MKIVICGDLVPTESNADLFEQAAAEQIIGQDLVGILKSSDICLCNLETPVTDSPDPIEKCGVNLITSTESLNVLPHMGITVVNLANNHILDQGEQGVKSTINELCKRDISYIGAGMDAISADSCYYYSKDDCKIGFYGIAEHEFSIASGESAGANAYDPLYTFDRIKRIKKECDYLIVLYHGGIEEYRYPSPGLQKICHKLAESGADFVVCQHSHCVGCEEEYIGATIVYGQGNFVFDRKNNEFWENGLLIEIDIGTNDITKKYIPIIKHGGTIKLADDAQKDAILAGFSNRSGLIKNAGYIEKEYEHFSQERILKYLSGFRGRKSIVWKGLNRILGGKFIFSHYRKYDYIRMRNYLECEAHLEVFLTALKHISQIKE